MAQFGRALRSGRRGCGFKSRHLDQKKTDSYCYPFSFYLNEELNSQALIFPNVFGTWGYEHDRIRWMIQGVFIGVAVKIVSDEQERPTILGTARGPLWVQIPSSRPNKVDNFDTTGIETINLFLFAKMLVAQGFSAHRYVGILCDKSVCLFFVLYSKVFCVIFAFLL